MKTFKLADITLYESSKNEEIALNFKEKVDLVKQLDKLNVDIIELNELSDDRTDILFYKTVAPIVENSIVSLNVGIDCDKIKKTYDAVSSAKKVRINVRVPISAVQMEYVYAKKPEKVLDLIGEAVAYAKSLCSDVEYTAEDALRSENAFMCEAISRAVKAGANMITICDAEGRTLPDEIKQTISSVKTNVEGIENCEIALELNDSFGMAAANMFAGISEGASMIKTSVYGTKTLSIESAVHVINSIGISRGISLNIDTPRLGITVNRLKRSTGASELARGISDNHSWHEHDEISLDAQSSIDDVAKAVKALGYELNEEDNAKVYEAFGNIAKSKAVGAKELDVIVANVALQVPQTYKLKNYISNSGNTMRAISHITLDKNNETLVGLCEGDGPIDAAFKAIEQIIGCHYELDDFQLQAVTEGREAMGEALVKLRSNGVLYSGRGLSTDIIGASIKAYVNALNKIVYEENV